MQRRRFEQQKLLLEGLVEEIQPFKRAADSRAPGRRDTFPTQEQRQRLIDGTLEFADLLPPGPDRDRLLEVAHSISFFADSALYMDVNPSDQHIPPPCGRPFSIVRGSNNVVEINMSSAVLHEIKQRAEKESVSLGQAITAWVTHAINSDGIRLH